MSFSSPNHFPIISYSKLVKPVTLLPGRARLATKPWPTGSATRTNTIGRDVCLPPQGGDRERTACYDHLCWQPNQFSRVGAHLVEIGTGVSIIDLNVMAGHPSDRLESLTQRLKIKLCIRIVLSYAQQHADASHPLGLLRARRERQRGRRAAEQRDELAAFHLCVQSITSSASASSLSGMWRPRVLAVVRLMMSSNLLGCSTGISPGFVPRRILST